MPANRIIFNEKYHDNCHDYLKTIYIEKYAPKKYKKFLYEIKKKIPIVPICNNTGVDTYANIVVCDQHAVIFGHRSDINPVLATYALNACVGLLMYVPAHGIGALAHIDGLPGYSKASAIDDGLDIEYDPVMENIKIILFNLSSMVPNAKLMIDFYLIGGIFSLSEVMINDILVAIDKFHTTSNKYRFNFRGRNLLGPENQSRNVCIDMRTGEITHFDYITNSEFYDSRNSDGTPINIIRAPRRSEAFLDITYRPIIVK